MFDQERRMKAKKDSERIIEPVSLRIMTFLRIDYSRPDPIKRIGVDAQRKLRAESASIFGSCVHHARLSVYRIIQICGDSPVKRIAE